MPKGSLYKIFIEGGKMMKSNRKALLLTLCALLLVVTSVFGTLAYLTDSEAVKNTFTVGKITLVDNLVTSIILPFPMFLVVIPLSSISTHHV